MITVATDGPRAFEEFRSSGIAYVSAVTGRRDEAIEILCKLERDASKVGSVSFFEIAMAYVGLNDFDGCFKWLERSFENYERFLVAFRYLLFLEKARKDQRFNDLLKKANLPPISKP